MLCAHTSAFACACRQFIQSENFGLWLKQTIENSFRSEIVNSDIGTLLGNCTEEQLIEAYTALKKQLVRTVERVLAVPSGADFCLGREEHPPPPPPSPAVGCRAVWEGC